MDPRTIVDIMKKLRMTKVGDQRRLGEVTGKLSGILSGLWGPLL